MDPKTFGGNPTSQENPAADEDVAMLDVMALMLPPTEWSSVRVQGPPLSAEKPEPKAPDRPENNDIDDNDLWIEVASQETRNQLEPRECTVSRLEEMSNPPSLPGKADRPSATASAEADDEDYETPQRQADEQDPPDDHFRLTGPVAESDIPFFTEIFSDLAPRPRMVHTRQVQIIVPGARKTRFERLCKKWKIRQATLHNLLIARAVRALENPTDEWVELLNQHRQAVIDRGKLQKRRQKKHLDEMLEDAAE